MSAPRNAGTLRFRRWAFWAYAVILFTGTHYPKLKLPGTGRPDLLIHFSIFGTWTAILIAAGFFNAPLSWRNIRMAAIIAPLYAAFDEVLQAIPFIHRTAAFDDWCANVGGIAIAVTLASLLKLRADRKLRTPPAVSSPSK